MLMNKLTRRGFVQVMGAATAASAIPSWVVASTKVPAKWDEAVDVVVVGSGFAGLAAAYEAKKAGATVALLEKMRVAGGNSSINGSILAVPGSPQQKKQGIKDSPELMAKDMIKAGDAMNHPAKVKALCEAAVATYEWTDKELGVQYQEKNIKQEGGHSVPRSLFTINGSGSEIVNKELAALAKLGVKPRLRTLMEEIIVNDEGRVVGVKIRENYRFPKKDSGKVKYLAAKRGLVLCYGGFSADAEFRQIYDPKLTSKFDTTNQPGATSEGWRAAMAIGAHVIQADQIQILPQTSPDEKGFGIGFAWTGHVSMFGVWVDAKTGKRFVNELANRKVRSLAILDRLNQGHDCLAIGDAATAASFAEIRPGMLKRQLERGVVFEFKTLDEVAKKFNTPVAVLKQTIEEYNKAVDTKKDPVGRPVNAKAKKLGQGPWYVARMSPKIHHCMGGLYTNEKAQVYHVQGHLIAGLYAAGEATGGVHGAVRLGSCGTADALINGRIAGQQAAANKPWM